ncbi:MAG TPA: DUF72 domain-containing protein [Gemmatimonadaceae bacterium]|nr:DUF72 domain-containing protein [Gemmatimonadaceae bacterium]
MYVGTAGWTDRTLTATGVFYPREAASPEGRLRYYASRFPMVEVDATYYALPQAAMAAAWADRTPDDFTFDVKAHALMTGHATEVDRLPAWLRAELPPELAKQRRVATKALPQELVDAAWAAFLDALQPLAETDKLGAILLQYPRWFMPGKAAEETLRRARARLGDVRGAVEFRNRAWLEGTQAARTRALLAGEGLSFVGVDAPRGLRSGLPPVAMVTAPALAVVRLHGRRADQWERRGATVAEKYRYLYDRSELAEWVPKVSELAGEAEEVHVVFNNCYGNYGTTNALEAQEMLAGR